MRFIKGSHYYIFFNNKFLSSAIIRSSDEYWSVLTDSVFSDYPVAVVLNDSGIYVWTDRVI